MKGIEKQLNMVDTPFELDMTKIFDGKSMDEVSW